TLEFQNAVNLTGRSINADDYHIDSGATLKFDGQVAGGSAPDVNVVFDAANNSVLDLSATTLNNFHGLVDGFGAGEGIRLSAQTGVTFTAFFNSGSGETQVNAGGNVTRGNF